MEENEKIWGVRGVPADVRQAVLTQCQKEGTKVGEWLTMAIREKIKRDRNQSKAVALSEGIKPLVRLQGMGIDAPDSMRKQATTLVRKCMTSVRKGHTVKQEEESV
ncbi:hypothetical protein A0U92_07325 [Acetobacter aceti]|uniref:Uncharacterized protein n=1 Tax=Acetobacter aceti TaxID=435 RepID=A0A1U9KFN6_ACEAC|nr:hypothetical protein [Acetobacter aceti]AQS84623.1 hypothetical protein A0U92_07325 [Acetobacter aceti]